MPQSSTNAALPLLVVEDHKDLADILQHVLKRAGFAVHLARTGREAEDFILAQPPPALVLLDLGLPYKDGFQLIPLIRSSPTWQRVPIVILSGRTRREDIERVRLLGANEYLLKPFQPADLVACVHRNLEAAAATP